MKVKNYKIKAIHNEADYLEAAAFLESIDDHEKKDDILEKCEAVLQLIEAYDEKHHDVKTPSQAAVLRYLMEVNDVVQTELKGIFSSQSLVSDILNGKRSLTLKQIDLLAKKFHVPIDVFLSPDQEEARFSLQNVLEGQRQRERTELEQMIRRIIREEMRRGKKTA